MSAAANVAFPWFQKLPRLGTDDEFSALRRLIDESGYTEEGVKKRLGIESIANYCARPEGGRTIQDPLDAMIALFFDCVFVAESKLAEVLPAGTVAVFDSLGLLSRDSASPGDVYATGAILPAFGLWTLCDRGAAPDGSRIPYPPDVVYPAVFDTTQRFVSELPAGPCEAMLDLGTGTGVAGLLGAPQARHVWATDITDRAVLFTEFNRRLAGLNNVTVAKGDLFEAVEGLTFDRIVIHPPYVPAKVRRTDHVFAVSGDDGEQILRCTIEGLPRFLRPGGRYLSIQVATDREGEDFEQRIRKWLGDSHREFDVVIAVQTRLTPAEYLANDQNRLVEESRNWLELWERTRTTFVVYATLLIERHRTTQQPVTRRVSKGEGYARKELDRLLEWHQALTRADHVEMLLKSRPAADPKNELRASYRLRDGRFQQQEIRLEVPGPFRLSLVCESWLAQLIPFCDGARTWGELFELAKEKGFIRNDVPMEEFARGLGVLVSTGALRLPDWSR